MKILDERQWSTRRAEEATGVNHADFARIRNANIGRFTLDRLMAVLGKLGQEVELARSIGIRPRPQNQTYTRPRRGGNPAPDAAIKGVAEEVGFNSFWLLLTGFSGR